MIVDLDAHQGNGHEHDHLDDEDTYIVDSYNDLIYPGDMDARAAIKKTITVRSSHSDVTYLDNITIGLIEAITEFNPEFIIYNAGTDILAGDPLGALMISPEAIIKRDEIVFELCLKGDRVIPVVMLMSGGYQMSNAEIIAESIQNLIAKFDLSIKSLK